MLRNCVFFCMSRWTARRGYNLSSNLQPVGLSRWLARIQIQQLPICQTVVSTVAPPPSAVKRKPSASSRFG